MTAHSDDRGLAADAGTPAERGDEFAGGGDLAGAEAAYREADAAGDAQAATKLGLILESLGRRDEALAAYARADERGAGRGARDGGRRARPGTGAAPPGRTRGSAGSAAAWVIRAGQSGAGGGDDGVGGVGGGVFGLQRQWWVAVCADDGAEGRCRV